MMASCEEIWWATLLLPVLLYFNQTSQGVVWFTGGAMLRAP